MSLLFNSLLEKILTVFKKKITFTDGSSIEFLDREALLYKQADSHQMEIMWFYNSGLRTGRSLSLRHLRQWDSPHENEEVDDLTANEILDKVVSYAHHYRILLTIEE